jgi:predicted RND superfamily exporter protein
MRSIPSATKTPGRTAVLRARLLRAALVFVTIASAWLTATKLRMSGDLSTLLPESGDAGALVRWTHAFGVRDPAIVLVRGQRPEDVQAAADAIAQSLRAAPSVARVIDRAPTPSHLPDPTLAWAYAGPRARARLASIVTPEGMRARLEETRAMLLAPAEGVDSEAWLARDPLRLSQVPWESRTELAAGVPAWPGGMFIADGGKARMVLAEPRGSAFVSADAQRLVEDVERAEGAVTAAGIRGVTTELSGGHAIAWSIELMLRHDLEVSGTLSIVLASLAFVLTFRRVRALAAVLPPLVLGTLWTTGIAALLPSGLSAVAIGFAAVVVGVGVDTGVHVYAALLEARRAGLAPAEAARRARSDTWQPTLTAAAVAAVAFGSLSLCGLRAVRELGFLCAAGELLTSVAILLVTPEIGAWLERGSPPPLKHPRWIDALAWSTATRPRALVAIAACASPIAIIAVLGWPRPADALVAVRPRALPPLVAQQHIYELFGGETGQWIVLSVDSDEETARTRADHLGEALEPLTDDRTIEGFDTLSTFAPSLTTQQHRLAQRDALDLPARRVMLEAALRDVGFDIDACAPALDAFAHPSTVAAKPRSADADVALSWLAGRHLAHDEHGTLVATYVRPRGGSGPDARARAAILAADPSAIVTGFDAIDRALRKVLSRDMLLIGGVSLALVALGMRVALRSARQALVALATLVCEIAAVGVAMRLLGIHWHVYDALVLPVLFGVTIDESMFLLHAARGRTMREALAAQGPLVAATALTTAAGFFALVGCRFDGLRDLGIVGTFGVLAGLAAALVLVPAALRVVEGERDA